MLWIDVLIIGVIAISSLISLIRGFAQEAFSLATWVAAFWLAWFFFRPFAEQLDPWIEVPSIRLGVAYGVILLCVLLIGGIVNHFLGLLVHSTGLSGTDRLIGMFFGAARGAVVVGILVLLAGLTPFPRDQWWQESTLIPYFMEMAVWMKGQLPTELAEKFSY